MVDRCNNYRNYQGGEKKLMGQLQVVISTVAIGLFVFALVGFGISFASDNNSPVSLANDPEVTTLYDHSNGNLSNFRGASEGQYQSIIQTTTGEGGTAPTSGPFAVTTSSSIGVLNNVLKVGYIKIFGTGSGFGVFMSTFIGIILFLIGLFVYKSLRGLPD